VWEVSVSFTDEKESFMERKGYECQPSPLGNVYYPKDTLVFEEKAEVMYVEYPWITCFEVEGIEILTKK
jgi:hypothetical protein